MIIDKKRNVRVIPIVFQNGHWVVDHEAKATDDKEVEYSLVFATMQSSGSSCGSDYSFSSEYLRYSKNGKKPSVGEYYETKCYGTSSVCDDCSGSIQHAIMHIIYLEDKFPKK